MAVSVAVPAADLDLDVLVCAERRGFLAALFACRSSAGAVTFLGNPTAAAVVLSAVGCDLA